MLASSLGWSRACEVAVMRRVMRGSRCSRRSLPLRGLVGGLVTSLLVVAVGSGAVVASTGASTVVTYAVSPGQTPNQVFPLVAPANAQPAELYYFTAEMYDSSLLVRE